jgi:hypothetical protein
MATRRPYVLILLPLVLAGCGGGGSSSESGGGGLSGALEKTLAQGSEKVRIGGKVDLSGQTLTLDGDGAFGPKGGKLHLNVELPIVGQTAVDEIVIGKRTWLRASLLGKKWVRLDSNPKALGFDARALTGVTPTSALRLLQSGSVSTISDNHYRVELGQTQGGMQFDSAEAWVDEHNLVRKVKLDFDANVSGTDKAHTVLTIDYSDFGAAVEVAPPSASEVSG